MHIHYLTKLKNYLSHPTKMGELRDKITYFVKNRIEIFKKALLS